MTTDELETGCILITAAIDEETFKCPQCIRVAGEPMPVSGTLSSAPFLSLLLISSSLQYVILSHSRGGMIRQKEFFPLLVGHIGITKGSSALSDLVKYSLLNAYEAFIQNVSHSGDSQNGPIHRWLTAIWANSDTCRSRTSACRWQALRRILRRRWRHPGNSSIPSVVYPISSSPLMHTATHTRAI